MSSKTVIITKLYGLWPYLFHKHSFVTVNEKMKYYIFENESTEHFNYFLNSIKDQTPEYISYSIEWAVYVQKFVHFIFLVKTGIVTHNKKNYNFFLR